MIDPDRRLLLSLKPRYADAILDGSKTIELRRTRPRIEIPTDALIYASSPRCAVVGTCRVVEVLEFTPLGMWRLHGREAAIDYAAYKAYFDGCTTAYGLVVAAPRRLGREIGLSSIRTAWRGFQPPQSFRYLSTEISDQMLSVAH
jgi:predicted transcriptional regulator